MRAGFLTFVLALLIALATFAAMYVVMPVLFMSGGIIIAMWVAWASGSLSALSRQPQYAWLHAAGVGVFVGALATLYFSAMEAIVRSRPSPPGASQGAPNIPMPMEPMRAQPLPPIPQRK